MRRKYCISLWSVDNYLVGSVIIKARSPEKAKYKLHKILDKLEFMYNAKYHDYYTEIELI